MALNLKGIPTYYGIRDIVELLSKLKTPKIPKAESTICH